MNCRNQFIKWKLSKDQTSDQHFSLFLTEEDSQAQEVPLKQDPPKPSNHTHSSAPADPYFGAKLLIAPIELPCLFQNFLLVDLANGCFFLPTYKPDVCYLWNCHLPYFLWTFIWNLDCRIEKWNFLLVCFVYVVVWSALCVFFMPYWWCMKRIKPWQ